MKKVLVIGSINQDQVFSVRNFPKIGETIKSDSFETFIGGKGANQAYALARMNSDISFMCLAGKDDFGIETFDFLKKSKVDMSLSKNLNSIKSGIANIVVDEKGDNEIILSPGANNLFGKDELKVLEEKVKNYDIVLFQLEINADFIYEAMRIVKENKKILILNPGPAIKLSEEIINICDLIVPNEVELFKIFGEENIDSKIEVEKILNFVKSKQKTIKTAFLVTLGSIGSVYKSLDKEFFIPAKKVKAIDTTAAGDTFIGAFISQIAKDMSVESAMNFATTASSICVQKKGAISSIPDYEEVLKNIK